MILTKKALKAIMPQAKKNTIDLFIESLNAAMAEYKINTTPRMAAFLAQIAHESGQLRYVEEISSGKAYEHRKDLGNLRPEALKAAHAQGKTTGRFYKGRGLIQITGYDNYLKCGQALDIDLVNNPYLLTVPEYAARSAAWFFNTHNCNELADVGLFGKITRVINGGYNGATERLAFYAAAKNALV